MIGSFRHVIQNEGIGALATGFGPTLGGYFMQGASSLAVMNSPRQNLSTFLVLKRPTRTALPSMLFLLAALSSLPLLLSAPLRLPVFVLYCTQFRQWSDRVVLGKS